MPEQTTRPKPETAPDRLAATRDRVRDIILRRDRDRETLDRAIARRPR
jgi:hypothetical protein